MKIAHLADLHIGKKLEEIDRNPEIKEALYEAAQIIAEKDIKAVILAGDIFEHARPSVESLEIFYHFLKTLKQNKVEKIFIISGNHDDEALLEIAKEFLEFSGIHIWGRISAKMDSYFLTTSIAQEEIFIAALPYVNDIKLLSETDKKKIEEKSQAQRYIAAYQIILDYFKMRSAQIPAHIPKIMIGHLFLEGAELSHTERESSLEKYLCVPKDIFEINNPFDYIALGHIHKYQESLLKLHKVYYSGSLIRLNFGEKNDPKGFRIYDTLEKKVEFIPLRSPKAMEEILLEVNSLEDLEGLKARADQAKLFKIKVCYRTGLLPLEIKEQLRSILGSQIKVEFTPRKEKNAAMQELKTISQAEDLLYYYQAYKMGQAKPEILSKLKELAAVIFEK